jgi:hypothetical protein
LCSALAYILNSTRTLDATVGPDSVLFRHTDDEIFPFAARTPPAIVPISNLSS